MVPQKEIAKALGVSAVTVSRALRNHPDLARETRDRILRKAQDLGYPRLRLDQGRKAIKRLGILLYEIDGEIEQNLFWMSDAEIPRKILGALHKEAQKNQIETIFETPRSDEIPLMVRNRTVDAAIIMGRYDPKVLSHLRDHPAILVSSYVANAGMARIVVDNLRGMEAVTAYMISQGHRQILFLGAERSGWTELHRERQRGYELAMYSHGLVPDAISCPGWDISPVTERLLTAKAIITSSDSLAKSVRNLLLEKGKSVPRDCSIASFDGNNEAAEWGLTTYSPDWALLGRTAVDFVSACAQSLLGSGVEVVIPGQLVLRDSVRAI